jgi:hypothetical protein
MLHKHCAIESDSHFRELPISLSAAFGNKRDEILQILFMLLVNCYSKATEQISAMALEGEANSDGGIFTKADTEDIRRFGLEFILEVAFVSFQIQHNRP